MSILKDQVNNKQSGVNKRDNKDDFKEQEA